MSTSSCPRCSHRPCRPMLGASCCNARPWDGGSWRSGLRTPLEFVQEEFEHEVVRAGLLFFNGMREIDLQAPGFGHSIAAILAFSDVFRPQSGRKRNCAGCVHPLAPGHRTQPSEHLPRRPARRVILRMDRSATTGRFPAPVRIGPLSAASTCVVGQRIRGATSRACPATMPPQCWPPTWASTCGRILPRRSAPGQLVKCPCTILGGRASRRATVRIRLGQSLALPESRRAN